MPKKKGWKKVDSRKTEWRIRKTGKYGQSPEQMPAQSRERKQEQSPEWMPAQSRERKQAQSPERMPAQSLERKQASTKPEHSNKSDKMKKYIAKLQSFRTVI